MIRSLRQLSYVTLFTAAWFVPAQAWIVQKAPTGGGANDCSGTGTIATGQGFCADGGCGNFGWGSYGTTNVSSSLTLNSGTNQVCFLFVSVYNAGITATSATWNTSQNFTLIGRQAGAVEGGSQDFTAWRLINPTATTATYAVTFTGGAPANSLGVMACYTGVNQTAPVNSFTMGVNNASASSFALSSTATGGNNCWAVGGAFTRFADPITAGSGTTLRVTQGGTTVTTDSNGTVTAGSKTLNYAYGASGTTPGAITMIIAPTP